ncbi:MAG: DUF3105 domain-containing protein [Chloroflexi bacterium]|nr:DUF3105 domain-containing protein [Chloroflexota bacterium]MYE40782.1 DUF3105 domain-containing protein [Chloroflexota bacterium]
MPESRHRRNRRPRNLEIPRTTQRGGTNKLILVGSIIIAVLVIGSFAAVPIFQSIGGPQAVDLGTAAAYVEGVGQNQEVMATKNHVQDGTIVAYNSVPATSGDHYFSPQPCGFYQGEVPDERVVHNLEHGNIVISYNLPDAADVDALENVYNDLGGWKDHYTVVRSYSRIAPGQVALSAWGVLDIMDGVDQNRIERFYEHYVGRLGPEGAISCRGAQQSMPGG